MSAILIKNPRLEVGQVWEGIAKGQATRRRVVAVTDFDVHWESVGVFAIRRSGVSRISTFRTWSHHLVRSVRNEQQ